MTLAIIKHILCQVNIIHALYLPPLSTIYKACKLGRVGNMLVFPFMSGFPRWLYLVLFLAFFVAAFLFKRYLRYSLRNGPRWGKSSVLRVKSSPRSSPVTPRPRPRPAPPAPPSRPATVTAPPVPRFDYCRRYPDLLALCGGDVVRADRLVDLESRSSGSAAPDVWVNLAISRFTVR